MSIDREVCICFHVSHRKLANFVRLNKPKLPSQMSECFGAGTGCGWCRPFLKKIFEQSQANSFESLQAAETTQPVEDLGIDLENLTVEQYAQRRSKYIQEQKENK